MDYNYGRDEEDYKHINQNILGGNVMNRYLVIMEGHCGPIDIEDYSCRGYNSIKFSPYPYMLQARLIIYSQVVAPGEIPCEGIYFYRQYQFSLLCFSRK